MEAKEGKMTVRNNTEVGEIDTSAPFQSVKHAVSLFGAVRFMKKKATTKLSEPPSAEENIVAKEARLHLAEEELKKFKEQLQDAENTKTRELKKLDNAKNIVDDLETKLLDARKSKDTAVKEAEMSMTWVKLKGESDHTQNLQSITDQHVAALVELNAAKKELTKVRRDYDVSMESKDSLLKRATDAKEAEKYHLNISSDLSNKIMFLKESILQERLATRKAQLDKKQIFVEKDVQRQAYEAKIKVSMKQLQDLQKEFTPEFLSSRKLQLESKYDEIKALQQVINSAKVSDLASVRDSSMELGKAKEFLQDIIKEENSLRLLIENLNSELGSVKNEVVDVTRKEAELDSLAEGLHAKLGMCKSELDSCAAEELHHRSSSDELTTSISHLSNESEHARKEALCANEEIKVLKRETEVYRTSNEKAKLKLQGLMQEAKTVKSAEAAVLVQIKLLSEHTNSARSSLSDFSAKLTLSKREFGSLKHKAKESKSLTEMKVSAAMAQVEAIKASENEYINSLHSAQKELEDLKLATADAMKRAAMSEAAKAAIEGELGRLSKLKSKKETEAALHIPHKESSQQHHTKKTVSLEKMLGDTWKSQNGRPTFPKRALSRIIQRK